MKFSLLTTEEIQLFKQRLVLIVGGLAFLLAILLFRLWFLQIINGAYYEEVAKGNRIRVVPQGAPRGIVYDRQGEILAFNRPAFDIQLIPEDTPDLGQSLSNLSQITGVPAERFQETVRAQRSGFKFKPITLLSDVGRKLADLAETYQEDLPGITVAIEPKRLYPSAFLTSHILGYVGVINEEQLSDLSINRLRSARIVGQSGIELVQNYALIGVDGGRQVEVDHVGRELKVLNRPVNPVPGMDIHLTLDLRLQRYVHGLMAGKKGVVIVSKPRTGEILSLVSFPDYDPNLFIGGIKDEKWEKMKKNPEHPLINKAVQGLYPPGSIFKLIVATAGLVTGAITPDTTVNCPGYFRINRELRYCWKRSGHGVVDLTEAIKVSCNVYFYQLGHLIGVDEIGRFARLFGFGRPTGIELESEKAGLVPSRAWKKRVIGEKWYDGETLPVSIGQGFLNVTPIQLLTAINVIANGGLWVQPTIMRKVVDPEGRTVLSEEDLPRNTRLLPVPLEQFDALRRGMVSSVNDKGTSSRARSRLFTIAGKTGTSEIIGRKGKALSPDEEKELDDSLLPHALFVGFAPAEYPQISVLVLVENGRSGGRVAAPLGKKILEYYAKNIEPLDDLLPHLKGGKTAESGLRFRRSLQAAFPPSDSVQP